MTSLPASQGSGSLTGRSSRYVLRGAAGVDVPADVVDFGTGRPVVFLHGLVGLNDHWEEVAQRIAHRCRCVMLQLPLLRLVGDDCSIQGATELTGRFLKEYFGGPTVLVGNSFGGHVALRLAIERRELLSGLVLAGSSGLIEKTMMSDIQIRPSRAWLERKIGELFHDKARMSEADVERAFKELSDRAHARAMIRLSRTARRNHLGDLISTIACPTLLLWGRQDIVTPPEAAYELKAKIRDSRLVWFDQCGHAPMIEAPEAFGDALNAFLDELDQRA
ncbi:MAG: alpha/beta hydrolase [Planctomycetota bacterium]|nr:alpha/beta hydrolase [Planctomycetota bacterium]